MSFRILKLSDLSEACFGMLKLDELGEASFEKFIRYWFLRDIEFLQVLC